MTRLSRLQLTPDDGHEWLAVRGESLHAEETHPLKKILMTGVYQAS